MSCVSLAGLFGALLAGALAPAAFFLFFDAAGLTAAVEFFSEGLFLVLALFFALAGFVLDGLALLAALFGALVPAVLAEVFFATFFLPVLLKVFVTGFL